jgi:hypothetical protein
MNNLFRITKDNVDSFFVEYKKIKQPNDNIHKTKTQKKSHHFNNQNQNEFKINQYLNTQNKIIEQNNNINITKTTPTLISTSRSSSIPILIPTQIPIQANFNYEKKDNNQINQIIEKKFNCEIKKIQKDTDIHEPIKQIDLKNNQINKFTQIKRNNENNENNENNNNDNNEKKTIFEYGKSSIKLDRLKKSMKYNFNIFSQIDNMIKNFLNFNPKIKLNTLVKNSNPDSNLDLDLDLDLNINANAEKKIHWNERGHITIESDKFFNIIINDKSNNQIEKKYNLIDFGYIKLYGITFTEDFINKHKIPSLNSIFTFSDNIRHFLKLIKLLEYNDKYKIKINQFGKYNLIDVITQNIPSIISNINDKKNLFDSADKNFTFYIKISEIKTTAFIIDKQEKIISYFDSVEKKSSGYIFFYIMELDSKYKIINLNKTPKTPKTPKTSKTSKTLKASKISKTLEALKEKNTIVKNNFKKEKSSSISDFSDSDSNNKQQIIHSVKIE